MAHQRLPPLNIEAEQSVLGSLLLDPGCVSEVAPWLRPEDFYRQSHALIYKAILDLAEKEGVLDAITLSHELEKRGQLEEVGGVSYLTTLVALVPTSLHVRQYGQIVEQASTLRRLIGAAGEIAGLAYEEAEEVDEIVSKAEEVIAAVRRRRHIKAVQPFGEFLEDYEESIREASESTGRMRGLPTGFIDLDAILGGLQKGDLVVIAGRPMSGKTGLALAMMENVLREREATIVLFNLEMSGEQVSERLVGVSTGFDYHQVRVGKIGKKSLPRIKRVIERLKSQSILMYTRAGATPAQVRSICQGVRGRYGLDLVIVDYLQLMSAGGRMGRVEEISFITRQLKEMAMELSLPVMALSQLSRYVEHRENKRPVLADLRESGAIEQDADVVLMLYAEALYDRQSERRHVVEVSITKHRSGPTGVVYLFRDDRGTFHDLETTP